MKFHDVWESQTSIGRHRRMVMAYDMEDGRYLLIEPHIDYIALAIVDFDPSRRHPGGVPYKYFNRYDDASQIKGLIWRGRIDQRWNPATETNPEGLLGEALTA